MVVVLHASFYARYDSAADGLRESFATVLLNLISRMGIGVMIFFVISGYCIAATVDATRRRSGFGFEYFRRRFLRIFPPYWAALAVTAILALVVGVGPWPEMLESRGSINTGTIPQPSSLSAYQWLGNLSLTEHWRFHILGDRENKMLGPSWTLCYEEQFYLVCGIILLIRPRRFFSSVVWVTLATVPLAVLALIYPGRIEGFFFDGRWLIFASGVFVYYHVNYAACTGSRLVPVGLLGALAVLLVSRYCVFRSAGTHDLRAMLWEFITGAGFAIVLLGLHPHDARLSRSALLRPIAMCGRMCYSLYLIHWPVSVALCAILYSLGVRGPWPTLLFTIPMVTAASLVAAWIFHQAVERRFLNSPSSPRIDTP